MSDVRMLLRLEDEPTNEEKQAIESLLVSKLKAADPNARVTVETKSGSWLLLVTGVLEKAIGWLIPELASWLTAKGLDQVQKKILPPASDDSQLKHLASSELDSLERNSDACKVLAPALDIAEDPIFRDARSVSVTVGYMDSEAERGVISRVIKTKDESGEVDYALSAKFIDSQEYFLQDIQF